MRGAFTVALMGIALAGCAPPEARQAPPQRLEELARPTLAPTAQFDAALVSATPDAEALDAQSADLSARASALRSRADVLGGPLMDAEDRRLLATDIAAPAEP